MRIDPSTVAFAVLAFVTLGSAGFVAFSRNIVHSAIGLLGTLLGVAGFYALLSADFLAVAQVLVYVGGTLTLVLFAVMLTARIDQVTTSNTPLPRRGAAWLSALLGLVLAIVAGDTLWPVDANAPSVPSTARIGHALLGPYAFPFEIASVALLMALVGAVVIARRSVGDGGGEPS